MAMINIKKKLDADLLVELCSGGFSGGDENGEFRISSINSKTLDEPIHIPHEALHIAESIIRLRGALNMILSRPKPKK
jgi:hypothetical protein